MPDIQHGSNYMTEIVKDIERHGFGFLSTGEKPSAQDVIQFLEDTVQGVPLDQVIFSKSYFEKVAHFTQDIGPMTRTQVNNSCSEHQNIIFNEPLCFFVFALLIAGELPSYQESIDQLKSEYNIYYDLENRKFITSIEPTDIHVSIIDLCNRKVFIRKSNEINAKYSGYMRDLYDGSLCDICSYFKNYTVALTTIDGFSAEKAATIRQRWLDRKSA